MIEQLLKAELGELKFHVIILQAQIAELQKQLAKAQKSTEKPATTEAQ